MPYVIRDWGLLHRKLPFNVRILCCSCRSCDVNYAW